MRAEALAREVRLLILDVDGVLTDGGIFYDHQGRIMKRFHVRDGLGVKMAQAAGLDLAVITGLDQPCVSARVRELGVTDYFPGKKEKIPVFEELLARKGLQPGQAAFMGDDWLDAGIMARVGLPMAVADAAPEILGLAAWVSTLPGGCGAVRQAVDFILRAQGRLEALWTARMNGAGNGALACPCSGTGNTAGGGSGA